MAQSPAMELVVALVVRCSEVICIVWYDDRHSRIQMNTHESQYRWTHKAPWDARAERTTEDRRGALAEV
jgi:hypothetical protein